MALHEEDEHHNEREKTGNEIFHYHLSFDDKNESELLIQLSCTFEEIKKKMQSFGKKRLKHEQRLKL